jgi:hypothetical protein
VLEYKVVLVPSGQYALNPTGAWKPYKSEAEPEIGEEITIDAETRPSPPRGPLGIRARVVAVDVDTNTITVEPID